MIPVAIIGAGPAGIASAIQLTRLGRDFVMFEKARVGGLLVNAHLVENYPGFPGGIPGPDLVRLMASQMESHSIAVLREKVQSAELSGEHLIIKTARRALPVRALVIASGTRPCDLQSPEIPAGLSDRVLYEVHTIRDVEGKRIAIIGAGDAAFDYALTLEPRNTVVILNRGSDVRCLPVLAERAERSRNVEHLRETRLSRIARSGTGVTLGCMGPNGGFDLQVDYALLAIGRKPEVSFLAPPLAATVEEPWRRWPVFFAGDVVRGRARQTALAVGDGVEAAMQIHAKLAELGQ